MNPLIFWLLVVSMMTAFVYAPHVSAQTYTITPVITGATTTAEGVAVAVGDTSAVASRAIVYGFPSGQVVTSTVFAAPSSARIALWAGRILRVGTPVGMGLFLLEYFADRYIYPSDDGGFVQAPGPMPLDANGQAKRTTQDIYLPGQAGFPSDLNGNTYAPDVHFVPLGYSYPVPADQYCVNGLLSSSPDPLPQPISGGVVCGGGSVYGGLFQGSAGQTPVITSLPSPDIASVEVEALPAEKPLPLTANEPIPVDLTLQQPFAESGPYTDPQTGEQVKTRYESFIDSLTGHMTTTESVVPAADPLPAPAPAPNPGTNPEPAPAPSASQCVDFPATLGCASLDVPIEEALNSNQRIIDLINPFSIGGAGQCPAPLSASFLGQTVEMSFDPLCQFADTLRPLVVALAWLSAGFIFVGGVKT